MNKKNIKTRDLSRPLARLHAALLMVLLTLSVGVGQAYAQQLTVSGKVTDNSGEALAGATVALKGTSVGAVSSIDGSYAILVPNREAVLVFSYVGYKPQEITVGSQTVINVELLSNAELEEVVVTGLGITKEARAVGYAVSTVKAVELTKVGTPNFATALYGKAAGVRINAAPGGQTSSVSMTVRGLASMYGNTQPLLVMDGVPIRNGNANIGKDRDPSRPSLDWRGTKIEGNGIVDINPEDVESISILKGAAASALYGFEAANGVILVTTKKGSQAGIKVDFSATATASYVAYMPEMQTEYGPGNIRTSQTDYELANGGFSQRTWKGETYTSIYQGVQGDNLYFGPKYDASKEVLYWDGKMRPYQAVNSNPLNDSRATFALSCCLSFSYSTMAPK